MKLLLAMIMMVLFQTSATFAQERTTGKQVAEESKATLEETMDWIASNINKDNLSKEDLYFESEINNNGCDVNVTRKRTLIKYTSKGDFKETNNYKFNLKDIEISEYAGGGLGIYTINGYNKINDIFSNSKNEHYNKYTYVAFLYYKSNSNIAERLVKAFNHAATLCGGGPSKANKKEPF